MTLRIGSAPPICRPLGVDPLEHASAGFGAVLGAYVSGSHARTRISYDDVTVDFV